MSRKKPKVVDTVKSPNNGAEAPLLLDQDRLEFIGEYGGVTFRHAEATKVRQWLYDRLEEQTNLAWVPVIQVHANVYDENSSEPRYENKAYFTLTVHRIYLGLVPGGGLLQSEWVVKRAYDRSQDNMSDDEVRYKNSKAFRSFQLKDGELALPRTAKVEFSRYLVTWMEYSEETYQGLLQLVKATDELGRRLSTLIQTKEGQQHLLNVGQKMIQLQLAAGDMNGESTT